MDDQSGVVVAVLVAGGVVLFLAGVGLIAVQNQTLIGGALMAAGVADLIAALVIRRRSA